MRKILTLSCVRRGWAAWLVLAAALVAQPAAAQTLGSGTITVNGGYVELRAEGREVPGMGISLSGTWTGTLTFYEATASGCATTQAIQAINAGTGAAAGSATSNALFVLSNQGLRWVCVKATAAMTGTATVTFIKGQSGGGGSASVDLSGASFSGNTAASNTGSAVPSAADYTGINVGGTLRGQTGVSVGSAYAGAVAIVDGSGTQITSFGGGTQFAEDVASANADVGTAAMSVRNDTVTGATSASGDYQPLKSDAAGSLWVNGASGTFPVTDNGGSLTVDGTVTVTDGAGALNVIVDSSALPTGAATAAKQPALGTAGSPSTDVISIQGVASGTAVPVSGSITCSNCSGTGVSVNEDVASANADPGTPAYTVRNDTVTGATGADGDYQPIKSDSAGRIYVTGSGGTFPVTDSGGSLTVDGTVTVTDGAGALNVIVDSGAITVSDGAGALNVICDSGCSGGSQYAEDSAHVSGDNFTMAGAIRRDTTPSSSSGTAGDVSALNVDGNGRLYVNATLYDTSGTALTSDTQATHATSLGTITSATGGLVMGNASNAAPTDVGADGDAAIPWMSRNGAAMVGGAVTTSAPTYTTATTRELSLDTAGSLRVNVTSAPTTTVTATNLDVQSNGADLATETTAAAILTSTNFAAAFGTAGSADSQVMSVQGIASGTPLATNLTQFGGSTASATNPIPVRLTNGASALTQRCADDSKVTSVVISTATSGNVELVALTSSQVVYVCGYDIVATGAVAVQFVYGTGTACATGETDLTGAMPFAANGGISRPNAGAVQFKGAASNALCVELSGAVQIDGVLTYVKE